MTKHEKKPFSVCVVNEDDPEAQTIRLVELVTDLENSQACEKWIKENSSDLVDKTVRIIQTKKEAKVAVETRTKVTF